MKKRDLLIEIEKLQSKIGALEKRVKLLENTSVPPFALTEGKVFANYQPVFDDTEPTTPTVTCNCDGCNRPPGMPVGGPTKKYL